MTPDQAATVTKVYRKFVNNDQMESDWTPIDEQMSMLEWINDEQLLIEASVKLEKLKKGNPRCAIDHPGKECWVPLVLDAIEAILGIHKENKILHPHNRFILQYYLALAQIGAIRS